MLVTYPDRRNLSANPGGTYATLHQLGSITPLGKWCNTPLSGVTPLRNKPERGRCQAGTLLIQAATPVGGGEAWLDTPAGHEAPASWRAPVAPEVLLGLAAAPVGGGKAWPGFEIDHSEPLGSRVAISRAGRRPRAHQAARPHSRIRRRPEHHPDPQPQPHTQQKAGRNPSVPARPQCSVIIGATRQVALRGRWRHTTGDHQCTTAVSCQ